MKSFQMIFYCMFFTGLCAQNANLAIENIDSGKFRLIKENKRIKITTNSGGKLVGRLQIVDENTIMLRGLSLQLNEIKKIKKHPVVGSIGNAMGFITLAGGTTMAGELISNPQNGLDKSKAPIYFGIGLSIAAIYGSSQPINFFDKGYSKKKWKFSIQQIE